jgi:hypothetical protein
MGSQKHRMDSLESVAELAIEAGILEKCEIHEVIFQNGGDITEAYKLANLKYSRGETYGFSSRIQLTDAIKEVMESSDYANDGCEACREQMS